MCIGEADREENSMKLWQRRVNLVHQALSMG